MRKTKQNVITNRWVHISPPVFIISAVLSLGLVAYTAMDPQGAEEFFSGINTWIIQSASWFYILSVAFFLVFVIFLGVSQFGRIKLGPDHSEPDYSYISWFAMLFSAGMGIGLMFFGVAEPIMHYANPPIGDPETVAAAREAMRITFFHWGMHAWAIYAVLALSLAYFAFRHNLPLAIRSALYPLIGDRIYGPIGHLVDILAVMGTLLGVATSLGFGVTQVGAGLEYLFGIESTTTLQVLLILGITAIATLSVASGLDAGIRRISELNILLAITLLLFVLIAGPTGFLLQAFAQNTGSYLSGLIQQTFNLYAYQPTTEPRTWIGSWTIFYWGWWIAWSPFVGLFIARISRGRTIREFVGGVLFVPVGFTFLWMTVFGDTALYLVMVEGVTDLVGAVSEDSAVALFAMLEQLPWSGFISILATILVVTFFVTSSDSGSLVVDMLTSGGTDESRLWQRIFWAVLEGLIAAALLLVGGLHALQTAVIATALPFAVIMLFMCWGLFRALNLETLRRTSLKEAWVMPRGGPPHVTWQRRLKNLGTYPKWPEMDRFLKEKMRPALEQVAVELGKQGLETRIQMGEKGRASIAVLHGNEVDFFYEVWPSEYNPPAFALDDSRSSQAELHKYYRAEVHLKEGSQDYDIMGLSVEEIIHDVIDNYERHLAYLNAVRRPNAGD